MYGFSLFLYSVYTCTNSMFKRDAAAVHSDDEVKTMEGIIGVHCKPSSIKWHNAKSAVASQRKSFCCLSMYAN